MTCQPEVGDLGHSVATDQHVLRLEIAMHDTGAVRSHDTATCGDEHVDDRAPRSWRTREPATERLAFDQLHREVHQVAVGAGVMHGNNVRV